MKKIIFTLMVAAQLGVFGHMIYEKNLIAKRGETYRFEVGYYDPYDFMRGNYLRLSMKQQEVEGKTHSNKKYKRREGYLILEKRGGRGYITDFSEKKPKEGRYIKGSIYETYDGKYMIENPFKRYYVEQSKAEEMENKLKKSEKAYIIVKIYKGDYVIEGIEI